jgi:hypothetical protein
MFFGSASTEGYCSVCYKAELKKREENMKKAQEPDKKTASTTAVKSDIKQPVPTAPIAISTANQANSSSNQTSPQTPNSSKITPISNSSSASVIANSAPVPITNNINNSLNSTFTTPIPSASSKRRNDDSICSTVSETPSEKSSSPSKPKKKRCGVCKKKIGLTGFECRCGLMFCPIHRYADQHGCTFDYAKTGKEQLRKDNPVVQDDKIVKF